MERTYPSSQSSESNDSPLTLFQKVYIIGMIIFFTFGFIFVGNGIINDLAKNRQYAQDSLNDITNTKFCDTIQLKIKILSSDPDEFKDAISLGNQRIMNGQCLK